MKRSYLKKGIALILVLGFIALFAAAMILSVKAIVPALNLTRHLSYSNRALYLAEAGAQKAVLELRSNYSWTGEGPISVNWSDGQDSYTGGQYETVVVENPQEPTRRTVTSTGYYPSKSNMLENRTIELVIARDSPSWFFDNAIAAGDDVNLQGQNYTIGGSVVYGDSISEAGLGAQEDDAALLGHLDFEQLRLVAIAQGNLYTVEDVENNRAYPASFWYDYPANTMPNVVYIETNLVLNGNIGTIGGFFIVAGDVITNPTGGGDTTLNGNGTIDGCVYTFGDFDINGGGNGLGITGGVWATGDVDLNGHASVGYNAVYMDAIRTNLPIMFEAEAISWRETH